METKSNTISWNLNFIIYGEITYINQNIVYLINNKNKKNLGFSHLFPIAILQREPNHILGVKDGIYYYYVFKLFQKRTPTMFSK